MTERFKAAVTDTLLHEGGYNNVKNDKGGATNWGISLRYLASIKKDVDGDGDVDWMDVRALSRDQAVEIYHLNFWRPFYDQLPDRIGRKVFDVAVNAGHTRAHILLQRALITLGSILPVDGMVGRITLNAAGSYSEDRVLQAFCTVQLAFYKGLVEKDASQGKFLGGWTRRALWTPKTISSSSKKAA